MFRKQKLSSVVQTLNQENRNSINVAAPHPISTEYQSLNEKQFTEEINKLSSGRNKVIQKYELTIQSLKELVQSLISKNEFLCYDRNLLLKDNNELKSRVESLESVIEVKKRLYEPTILEKEPLFQIIVESKHQTMIDNNSAAEEESTIEGVVRQVLVEGEEEEIVEKQNLFIANNPFSYHVSPQQECELSLANINAPNRTFRVANTQQTPGLLNQNLFIQCSSSNSDGVIRAFYLCLIQNKSTSKHLIQIIQTLKDDSTVILFDSYPSNQIWCNFLGQFIKEIQEGKFYSQAQMLEHIQTHSLIDILMIKCLKSRMEFLFTKQDSFESLPATHEIFFSLANQFGMRIMVTQSQFVFFTKEIQDENLLLSERASLEISLNNQQENKYFVKEEEPTFVIHFNEDILQFKFFIVGEADMALSHFQINEKLQSFNYSEEKDNLMASNSNQKNSSDYMFEEAGDVLNQRNQNSLLRDHFRPKIQKKYTQKENISCEQSINTSRYFLKRVESKNSDFQESY